MDAIIPTLPDKSTGLPPVGENHAISLANHLVYLYNNKSVTDISVKCGDETFDLHSPVLSHGSGYFRRVFANDPSEIVLEFTPSIEASVFRIIVESLYMGQVKNITEENVTMVLEASYNMQVQIAMDACVEFMLDHLDHENCLNYWLSARHCDNKKIQKEAIGLIGRHLSKISQLATFLNLQSFTILEVLGDDNLQVSSEVQVYEAAMAWLKCEPETRKCELSRLLDVIRLSLLPVDYLVNIVGKEDLIEENSETMKQYSTALRMQLGGGESKAVKPRHNVIHGMRGEYERVAKSVRVSMRWKKDRSVVSIPVRGLFSQCCIPEDRDDGRSHVHRNIFVEFGASVQGRVQKVGNGVQDGAKKIGDGVQGLFNGIGSSLKKAGETIANTNTFDNLNKRQVGGFWLDVTNTTDDVEETVGNCSPKQAQDSSGEPLDLSSDDKLQESFSLRQKLADVAEVDEDDLSDTTPPFDMDGLSVGTPLPIKFGKNDEIIETEKCSDEKVKKHGDGEAKKCSDDGGSISEDGDDEMGEVSLFDDAENEDYSKSLGEDLLDFLDVVSSESASKKNVDTGNESQSKKVVFNV